MCSLVGSEAENTWGDDWDWQILLTIFMITPSVYLEWAQQELHREMSLTVQNSLSESSCNCWPAALLGSWPVLQLIISSHWSSWASLGIMIHCAGLAQITNSTTPAVTGGQDFILISPLSVEFHRSHHILTTVDVIAWLWIQKLSHSEYKTSPKYFKIQVFFTTYYVHMHLVYLPSWLMKTDSDVQMPLMPLT